MKSPESLGRFPFNQNHVLEISGPKLNGTGKVSGEIFENLCTCTLFKSHFCVPFATDVGFSLPTKRELTWTREKWRANSSGVHYFLRQQIARFPGHLQMVLELPRQGIVTSKYPFTWFNLLRIQQATAARSITLSLLSRMVQLIVSESSCYKAAKMFKKFAIFQLKHNKVHPACPVLQSTWAPIVGRGRTRSIRPVKIPKIFTDDFCWK